MVPSTTGRRQIIIILRGQMSPDTPAKQAHRLNQSGHSPLPFPPQRSVSMMSHQMSITRRGFLKGAATVGTAAAIPYLVPSGVLAAPGRPVANDRIGIGIIGCGRRAQQLLGDLQSVTGDGGPARIVALSDVWTKKWQEWIAAYEKNRHEKGAHYATYPDYRKLLERSDVDGVVIATCDHWHALPAVHACQAGKDVDREKPLSLTIREGRQMVEAVRKHERVFQTGAGSARCSATGRRAS